MDYCVFVHTNRLQMIGALVSQYSMKRNSAHADKFETRIIHTEDHPFLQTREGQSFLRDGVQRVWKNDDLPMYMSSPVLIDGKLLGMSNKRKGHLFQADPGSGESQWAGEGRLGHSASLVNANGTLLVTTTEGVLQVWSAPAEAPTLVASYELADSAVYAHPAFAGRTLILRDKAGMTAWRLPEAPSNGQTE